MAKTKESRRTFDYRNRDHGGRGSSSMPGDYTLIPGVTGIQVVRMQGAKGPMWIRIFPTLRSDDPKKFEPIRYSTDPQDFTQWMLRVPAARYCGVEGGQRFTAFLHMPSTDSSYDPWQVNPYHVLYGSARRAFKRGRFSESRRWNPDWNSIVNGRDAGLRSPDALCVAQGLVYENGQDKYFKQNGIALGEGTQDGTIIIQMTKSAGEALFNALELPNEKWNGAGDDWENAYKYGDIIAPKQGRFVCIHDPDAFPKEEILPSKKPRVGRAKDRNAKKDFTSYSVIIRKTYESRGQKVSPSLADKTDMLRKRIRFWPDVLRIPSHEELAAWIAHGFKPVPKLLIFAWQDHPEFLTDEVSGILNARKVASVDGLKGQKKGSEDGMAKKSKKELVEDEDLDELEEVEDEDLEDEDDDNEDADEDEDGDDEDDDSEDSDSDDDDEKDDDEDSDSDDEDSDDEDEDEDSDSDDDEDEDSDSDDEEEEEEEKPAKKPKKGDKKADKKSSKKSDAKPSKKPSKKKDDDEEEEEEDDEEDEDADEDDGDDDSDDDADDDEDEDGDDSDEDEDADEDSDDEDEDDGDDDSDDEDEEEEEKPSKKPSKKGDAKPGKKSKKEEAPAPSKKDGKKGKDASSGNRYLKDKNKSKDLAKKGKEIDEKVRKADKAAARRSSARKGK